MKKGSLQLMKNLARRIYLFVHRLLHKSLPYNPFFPNSFNGKRIKSGHISSEHIADPQLDNQLIIDLSGRGIKVSAYSIKQSAFHAYLNRNTYPETYYGGGKDPSKNFVEKSLEHFVSLQFIPDHPQMTFVDIAACNSPFYKIISREKDIAQSYQQDLIYPKGVHSNKIGGYGHELQLPEESVDAVTLHCSLEHFEGESDIAFFRHMQDILKPGGRIIVLPFYLAYEYTIHIDPVFNLLKRHKVDLKHEDVQLRYASWRQYFSRHYDPQALQQRLLDTCPKLDLHLYYVTNFKDIDEACYLRFVGVFEKK